VAKVKKDAEWLKVEKYTHYLNYENYSQSVLSKLIQADLMLMVSFGDGRWAYTVKDLLNIFCNAKLEHGGNYT